MGILGCHKPKDSQSEPMETREAIYQKLRLDQTRLIDRLEKVLEYFKKSGSSNFKMVPSPNYCRPTTKFAIEIRDVATRGITSIKATITVGKRFSRVLEIVLTPSNPKTVKIYFKQDDFSFDHEIPMIQPAPQNDPSKVTELSATSPSIYADFAKYYRGNDPEEFTPTPTNIDSQLGYNYWLLAMGDLNEYLVNLQHYQKSLGKQ